ncbi:hypothetical protein CRG98_015344 [Punica granatum]|uniref:Uncharacterized protein n=1 Tax=Punica granatum TaxID=22663 RepID=A0A2I0K6T8_PUNGR|nr:hypothetical protein CRG98_015344 [Punica granatum]
MDIQERLESGPDLRRVESERENSSWTTFEWIDRSLGSFKVDPALVGPRDRLTLDTEIDGNLRVRMTETLRVTGKRWVVSADATFIYTALSFQLKCFDHSSIYRVLKSVD